jgi:hypothetical protein
VASTERYVLQVRRYGSTRDAPRPRLFDQADRRSSASGIRVTSSQPTTSGAGFCLPACVHDRPVLAREHVESNPKPSEWRRTDPTGGCQWPAVFAGAVSTNETRGRGVSTTGASDEERNEAAAPDAAA